MKKHEIAVIAVGCLIAVGALAFIAWNANRQSTNVAATIASVMLQSMDRGYQCHAAGRDIDDCKTEQREIWRKVEAHEPYKPFG